MGMDIQIKPEEVFQNEDRRWLGTRKGTLDMRSMTLGSHLFEAAHIADKGAVPSGTALGQYPNGLVGPYDPDGGDEGGVFVGHLWSTTKIDIENEAPIGVAVFWTGVVKYEHLPTFDGVTTGMVDADFMGSSTDIRYEDSMNQRVPAPEPDQGGGD